MTSAILASLLFAATLNVRPVRPVAIRQGGRIVLSPNPADVPLHRRADSTAGRMAAERSEVVMDIEISDPDARRLLMLLETSSMFPDVVDELRGALTQIDTAQPTTPIGESVAERVNAAVVAMGLTPGAAVTFSHRMFSGNGETRRPGFFDSVEMPSMYCDGQILYANVRWAKRDGTPGPTTTPVDIRKLVPR